MQDRPQAIQGEGEEMPPRNTNINPQTATGAPLAGEKRKFEHVIEEIYSASSSPGLPEVYESVNLNYEFLARDTADEITGVRSIKAEWLFLKQDGHIWRRRYVKLMANRLEWYSTPFACEPEGVIMVYCNLRVDCNSDLEALLFTIMSSNMTVHFRCDSLRQLEDWNTALTGLLDFAPVEDLPHSRPSSPSRQAFLLRTLSSSDENASDDELKVKFDLRSGVKELEKACSLVTDLTRTERRFLAELDELEKEIRATKEKELQSRAFMFKVEVEWTEESKKLVLCEESLKEAEASVERANEMRSRPPSLREASTDSKASSYSRRRSWSKLITTARAVELCDPNLVAMARASEDESLSQRHFDGRLMYTLSRAKYEYDEQLRRTDVARVSFADAEESVSLDQSRLRALARQVVTLEEAFDGLQDKIRNAREDLHHAESRVRHCEHQLEILRSLRRRQTEIARASIAAFKASHLMPEADQQDEDGNHQRIASLLIT